MLTDPEGWGDFFDVRILGVEPGGLAQVGQRFWGESGPRALHLGVAFTFTEVDADRHRLGLSAELPLGIAVREGLDCVALSPMCCRVNYHRNFDFPEASEAARFSCCFGAGWILGLPIRFSVSSAPQKPTTPPAE